MNYTVFRLITGKLEGTYSLKRGVGLKNGVLKDIAYRPGTDSIFEEDNKGSVSEQKEVVFKYNDLLNDPAIEVVVPNANKVLIDFLRTHAKFGVDYIEYNQDKVSEERTKLSDDIFKALEFVNVSDDNETHATALAVFGLDYFSKSIAVCRADLKEKAVKEPKKVIDAFSAPDFKNKYVSSLAFCSDVIKMNNTNTAIVWTDTNSPIISIAKGENGIDKLAEFLGSATDETKVLLQEFQARLDKKTNSGPTVDASKELKQKDKKIAELEAKLAAATNTATETKPIVEPVEDDTDGASGLILETDEAKQALLAKDPATMNLAEAQAAYVLKFKKPLPIAYKNKIEWLVAQLTKTE